LLNLAPFGSDSIDHINFVGEGIFYLGSIKSDPIDLTPLILGQQ